MKTDSQGCQNLCGSDISMDNSRVCDGIELQIMK